MEKCYLNRSTGEIAIDKDVALKWFNNGNTVEVWCSNIFKYIAETTNDFN